MFVSDGLSNTFTPSNQLSPFAQQCRYVPVRFYNRIKITQTQTVCFYVGKKYPKQTTTPSPRPRLQLSEVGALSLGATLGY